MSFRKSGAFLSRLFGMAFWCLRISKIAADINVARDDSPLGHDKPWCDDVANDRACRSNVELLPGSHVSRHRTANRDILCDQVRCNRGGRSDGQAMVAEFNRPLHVAINRQIFSADDLALDSDRPSNPPSQSAFIKRRARTRRKPWSHSFARAIPVPHPVPPLPAWTSSNGGPRSQALDSEEDCCVAWLPSKHWTVRLSSLARARRPVPGRLDARSRD